MEKCSPSYGSKSQKVHSLKGEFLCPVFLEGQRNPELGYSGIQQEQCCSIEERDCWMEGQGETEAGVGFKEVAGW